MLYLLPTVQLLGLTNAVKAAPFSTGSDGTSRGVDIRSAPPPPPFKCMEGFELTAYTSTGITTCTKIAGSSILPGYSGQTVAAVGLISGLTGLMMGCLPVAKFFYRTGTGYFRQGQGGPSWNNAFPRAISADSAVDTYPTDGMHLGWLEAFHQMQQEAFDPQATYAINSEAERSTAIISHSGMNITHQVAIIPHNSTHVTWNANTDIAYTGVTPELAGRATGWTGGRVTVNNYPIDGVYHDFPITYSQARTIADSIVARYIANIYTGTGSQICAFLGSEHTVVQESYAAAVSISSQEDYGLFEASKCPIFWQAALDPNDEL